MCIIFMFLFVLACFAMSYSLSVFSCLSFELFIHVLRLLSFSFCFIGPLVLMKWFAQNKIASFTNSYTHINMMFGWRKKTLTKQMRSTIISLLLLILMKMMVMTMKWIAADIHSAVFNSRTTASSSASSNSGSSLLKQSVSWI